MALADLALAGGEQQPLQAPAPMAGMQGQETLQNAREPDEVSLDMQRYYSKHQLPSLSYYGIHSRPAHTTCPAKPAPTFSVTSVQPQPCLFIVKSI